MVKTGVKTVKLCFASKSSDLPERERDRETEIGTGRFRTRFSLFVLICERLRQRGETGFVDDFSVSCVFMQ